MRARRESGFTLIELMMTMVILGLLMMIGVPQFRVWMQNVQIRTAAESVLNGMQTARNEAIRRNEAVQIKLTTGSGWIINTKADPDADPPVMKRAHEEGSDNASLTVTPGGADTVTFTALGRVDTTNQDGSAIMNSIVFDNTNMPAAESRELRIVIPTGGGIKLCDPQAPASDPRSCPP